MSLNSQREFLKQHHPFDKLNDLELDLCQKNMDIGYYPKDTIIISPQKLPDHFFIIIKGEVNELNNQELTTVYHQEDSFDADSLMYEKTNSIFKVAEDLICYEMNKKTFLTLIETNESFKRFYLKKLSSRLQTLKREEYKNDMSGFMVAKINEIHLHKPCIVDIEDTIKNAIAKSVEYKTSTIIVQNKNKYGIITDSLLKKNVLLKELSLNTSVKLIAKFPFICVNYEDFLFQVLLMFTKKTIKRVGVMKNGELVGIVDQIDILSYFANHTYLVASKIQNAKNISDLQVASIDILKIVKSLFIKSVKTAYIAKMVAELNAKVYEKLYSLIVPTDLQNEASLIVMGSEGRNEQILKTDQDNALIIKNGINEEKFIDYMKQFNQALLDFGFPKCEGNIMVTNPYWRKNYNDFQTQIDTWLNGSSMNDYMNLAIFYDSKVVAGNQKLFKDLQKYLFANILKKDVFLAYFANATLAFDTPIGLFSNLILKDDRIDLKKGAIFAIVHGIRSLALKNKLKQHSTIARIKKLNQLNIIKRDFASELIEAFGLLLRLKLQDQIDKLNKGKPISNSIEIKNLTKIERDMIKDSFLVVNKFKKFISYHFKLDKVN